MNAMIWIGVFACLSQSAVLSGSNLAFFSISKLRLEMETKKNNPQARLIASMRADSNFLLVTILWANVAVNVLLALLTGSVLTGTAAFLFSTVVITIVGEIIPQAYFSRHAMKVAATVSPLIRIYQFVLYPVAKPTACLLDRWLGKEAISFYREQDLRELIQLHMGSSRTDIDPVEGKGALNFLALDDLPLKEEGERVDPRSILTITFQDGRPMFPQDGGKLTASFIDAVMSSGKKWIILTDSNQVPRLVLNADKLLREVLLTPEYIQITKHCHRPIVIWDEETPLGDLLPRFRVNPEHGEDDVIDEDIALLWGKERKIITGSDLLGRLLRGIAQNRIFGLGSVQRDSSPPKQAD